MEKPEKSASTRIINNTNELCSDFQDIKIMRRFVYVIRRFYLLTNKINYQKIAELFITPECIHLFVKVLDCRQTLDLYFAKSGFC